MVSLEAELLARGRAWVRRSSDWGSADHALTAVRAAGPPLLFGLRLWASVCLALHVAFWLELDNAYWAGTSAAIVCQPGIGASLRKGWFRMIGTVIGAIVIVALTACFSQDRGLFLVALALWGAACAFVATILRNFAAYAAALAGYTAAIVAGDLLGATGGINAEQAFMFAITRLSEISIGIVSAGVILAATDLGGAARRLAGLLAGLAAGITENFCSILDSAGPCLPDTQPARREFIRRVIGLDPVIDETIGESSSIRYHSPVLQKAVDGLFTALAGWRTVANHLVRLPHDKARIEAAAVLRRLPPELLSLMHADPHRWTSDPAALHRLCETTARGLIAWPAGTASLRLIADKTADVFTGMAHALNALALLVADPARSVPRRRGTMRLRVPDWLPAAVNAGRAFVTIGAVALFWIATTWPNGAQAITFAAIGVILFAPRADAAYALTVRFAVGTLLGGVGAGIINFAVLPLLHQQDFAAFALALGLYLVPTGALAAQPWNPAIFTAMAVNFVPILAPENAMSYDPVQLYNTAVAIVAGIGAAAFAFRLLPPLSPAFRTRRLLALVLRDLRCLATGRRFVDWEGRIHGRLSAMPEAATPLQRAQLLAALSVGTETIRLRETTRELAVGADLDPAFAAVAQGDSADAIAQLARVDAALADRVAGGPTAQAILRARGSILALSEALTQHAEYFDAGAPG